MRKTVLSTLSVFLLCVATVAAQVELLQNGGFESGLTEWSVQTDGNGDFILMPNNGQKLFFSDRPVEINPNGDDTYAVTDQILSVTQALSQEFTIPLGTQSLSLSFDCFSNNWAATSITPNLIFNQERANQHYRIDVLLPSASPFSTDPADVVMNIQTGGSTGAVNPNPWQQESHDLSMLTPGESYRLRFAAVQNRGDLNLALDNVSIMAMSNPDQNIPTMSQWSLLLFGLILTNLALVTLYNLRLSHDLN